MALLNFDTDSVELQTYEVLPEGIYEAVITDSRMQTTKSGTGEMLVLTLEVISGDYKGRKLWDRLNLVNPNPTAVVLARQALAHLCLAIGVHQLHDTIELHNRPTERTGIADVAALAAVGQQRHLYIRMQGILIRFVIGQADQVDLMAALCQGVHPFDGMHRLTGRNKCNSHVDSLFPQAGCSASAACRARSFH